MSVTLVMLQVMEELVNRDKNRPSVIAWSIANEPVSNDPKCEEYFTEVANYTRSIDPAKRIVMAVLSRDFDADHAAPALDMIGFNRYYSWYSDPGRTEYVTMQMNSEVEHWRRLYPDKPFMITEYGGDTIR